MFLRICICCSVFLFVSCQQSMSFDKTKWNQRNSIGSYDYRDQMLEDLIAKHKLKGKSINDLRDIFGEIIVFKCDDQNCIHFNIVTEYGNFIDPVYTKDLIIFLNKDSIVSEYKIREMNY